MLENSNRSSEANYVAVFGVLRVYSYGQVDGINNDSAAERFRAHAEPNMPEFP